MDNPGKKSGGGYELEYENYKDSVEKYYFWIVEFLKDNLGYDVEKIEDEYASSETSSWWANLEQRKGLQQDKASQYLGTIGGMIKSMQQILRDLRIMDERWEYYQKSNAGDKGAEVALKSLWTDLVEGGAQNPRSVFGMAAQVGFVTLPDLFFDITPKTSKDVDAAVDKIDGVNDSVKRILKRKLYQYMEWKEQTEKEISTRRNFTLKYLRQHFNVVKLYIGWVKPYLRNIRKLQQGETINSTDLLTSSEGAVIDLEILAVKKLHEPNIGEELTYKYKKYFPVVQVKIHWRTRPALMYQQEYQKGPLHLGRATMKFYAYTATKEDLEKYREAKDKEDMELLSSVNASIDAIKDDLDKYLKEAGELIGEEEEAEEKKSRANMLEAFAGFGQLFALKKGIGSKGRTKETWSEKQERESAKAKSSGDCKIVYEIFKKAHQMVQW